MNKKQISSQIRCAIQKSSYSNSPRDFKQKLYNEVFQLVENNSSCHCHSKDIIAFIVSEEGNRLSHLSKSTTCSKKYFYPLAELVDNVIGNVKLTRCSDSDLEFLKSELTQKIRKSSEIPNFTDLVDYANKLAESKGISGKKSLSPSSMHTATA